MQYMVGVRKGIKRYFGQAHIHRQSNNPTKAVCGVPLGNVRQVDPNDYWQRCPHCFDKQLGKHTKAYFERGANVGQ